MNMLCLGRKLTPYLSAILSVGSGTRLPTVSAPQKLSSIFLYNCPPRKLFSSPSVIISYSLCTLSSLAILSNSVPRASSVVHCRLFGVAISYSLRFPRHTSNFGHSETSTRTSWTKWTFPLSLYRCILTHQSKKKHVHYIRAT